VVAGFGIDVWEVVLTWKETDEDLTATLGAYPGLSEVQVRATLGYYARFPAETAARHEPDSARTEDRVRRELPYATPRRA